MIPNDEIKETKIRIFGHLNIVPYSKYRRGRLLKLHMLIWNVFLQAGFFYVQCSKSPNPNSMEISGFFCQSDFTWNQFWQIQSIKNDHFPNLHDRKILKFPHCDRQAAWILQGGKFSSVNSHCFSFGVLDGSCDLDQMTFHNSDIFIQVDLQ